MSNRPRTTARITNLYHHEPTARTAVIQLNHRDDNTTVYRGLRDKEEKLAETLPTKEALIQAVAHHFQFIAAGFTLMDTLSWVARTPTAPRIDGYNPETDGDYGNWAEAQLIEDQR